MHPPICHIFTTKKSVDKSGLGDESGDKSGDAQYLDSTEMRDFFQTIFEVHIFLPDQEI